LPFFYYNLVARLRDTALTRLNADELLIFKHQHTILDLEAFLIVTALLSDKEDMEKLAD
jgi:hypothetical protein